jgi:hypothetical protein
MKDTIETVPTDDVLQRVSREEGLTPEDTIKKIRRDAIVAAATIIAYREFARAVVTDVPPHLLGADQKASIVVFANRTKFVKITPRRAMRQDLDVFQLAAGCVFEALEGNPDFLNAIAPFRRIIREFEEDGYAKALGSWEEAVRWCTHPPRWDVIVRVGEIVMTECGEIGEQVMSDVRSEQGSAYRRSELWHAQSVLLDPSFHGGAIRGSMWHEGYVEDEAAVPWRRLETHPRPNEGRLPPVRLVSGKIESPNES